MNFFISSGYERVNLTEQSGLALADSDKADSNSFNQMSLCALLLLQTFWNFTISIKKSITFISISIILNRHKTLPFKLVLPIQRMKPTSIRPNIPLVFPEVDVSTL